MSSTQKRPGTRQLGIVRMTRRRSATIVLLLSLFATPLRASSVLRDSAELDGLIAPGAELRSIQRQNDGFYEGPSWVERDGGYLVVSAIPDNQLLRIDGDNKISVLASDIVTAPAEGLIHDTLYTNRDLLGSNGTFYAGGRKLFLALFGGRSIALFDLRTHHAASIASGERAPLFHYPNDLALGPRGDLFFTAHEGIFRLHRGSVTLFRKMAANGLAFTPDRKALYASDGASVIVKIVINPDGSAGDTSTFLDTHGDPAKDEFLDGMKVDTSGNLWAVAPGGIWILNSRGERLGRIIAPTIDMPAGKHSRFTNLAFGGHDGATLYLTAPGGIYSIRLARSATARP